jgi:saccharopine dehydrogenase-like NADP-dependent oxidoreductase
MRVALLGAAGQMAHAVLRDLLDGDDVTAVTCADREPVLPEDSRVTVQQLDVRDVDATAGLLTGHDVVLNCVTYYLNLEVMRAALQARVPYADLGGLYHMSQRQFTLDEEFKRAGVSAVLGMGSTPGITNAMAGAMARGLDVVERIHVRVASSDAAATGPLSVPYALDTLLDEFSLEPMVWQEGSPVAVSPMSGTETIDFPAPLGHRTAIFTLHSEVAMFPRSFPGLREASFKIAFEEELVEKLAFLVQLGFADRRPAVDGVSPRQMLLALASRQPARCGEPGDVDVLRVDLAGMLAGERVRRRAEVVVRPHSRWGSSAGALDTGIPLAIVGRMLARGEIAGPGVLCPETCLDFDRFFRELERREIRVEFGELPT